MDNRLIGVRMGRIALGVWMIASSALATNVSGAFDYVFVPTDVEPWATGEKSGLVLGNQDPAALTLESFVQTAKKSISAAVYGVQEQDWFLDDIRGLIAKKRDVRFVVDQDRIDGKVGYTYADTARLPKILGSSRFVADTTPSGTPQTSSIMHNKFIVVDHAAVWMGSTNVTNTCLGDEYNANTSMIVRSPELAQIYEAEFNQMFVDRRFSRAKQPRANADTLVYGDGTRVDVFFSPQDDPVATAVVPFIDAARRSLDVGMFFLTSTDVSDAMIRAVKRGVRVRLLYDAVAARSRESVHAALRDAGIEVRVENWGGKMHAKTAVADGKNVLIGSMNWSRAGSADNDENTLVIRNNARLARDVSEWFDRLWKLVPTATGMDPRAEGRDSINSCQDGIDNNYDGFKDSDDAACS